MMFHRAPGELVSELAEMDECMPHYYRITDGHGQGAETIMRAEALFCRGHFTDAHIELERAYAQIRDNGQENMALCCDFLAWRLSLCAEVEPELTLEERRRCCGCTTPRGSTSGTPQPRIIMRCGASRRGYRSCLRSTGFPRSISLRRASP